MVWSRSKIGAGITPSKISRNVRAARGRALDSPRRIAVVDLERSEIASVSELKVLPLS